MAKISCVPLKNKSNLLPIDKPKAHTLTKHVSSFKWEFQTVKSEPKNPDLENLRRADLNGDNIIDDHDLLQFLFCFPKEHDINKDGSVDEQDLQIILKNFGKKI
ncbi:MAG: hypothetical protein N2654_04670 [Deltaproteobacteria bacterium]|nr:hypothetical protein [Deltaproteobacteria bacterium]